jgi:hypothetical protein
MAATPRRTASSSRLNPFGDDSMRTTPDHHPGYFAHQLTNPFAAYALGFSFALAVYSLGYSDLYPPLQPSLVFFLLATCLVCVLLAVSVGGPVDSVAHRRVSLELHSYIFLVLMAVFAAEIVYNGGIPLLLIATGADFNYQEFGIPEVHVAFVGFCNFYAVYWFDVFILERRRIFIFLSLTAASTSLLIFSRGSFLITLTAIVFVYVQRRGIGFRLLQSFAVLLVAALWGFGLLGDLRTHGASGESIILNIGEASDSFVNSSIPTEIFWPYLYISSPLANLQLNMTDRVAADSPATYFEVEFLPDFISKRVVSEAAMSSSAPLLINDQLAVATMYGRSFLLLGWLGLLLTFCYFVVVSMFFLRVLRSSKYFVAACSILSSLAFFNVFDSMYLFVGGILQVLVALFLHLFERRESPPGFANIRRR